MRKLRTTNKLRFFTRNERGGALAELAILIPFLVLMVAAVSELGRLFQTFDTLSKSTRSAARYLTTVAYTDDSITKTKNMALCGKAVADCGATAPLAPGLTISNIDVVPEWKDGGVGGGNPIRVTVSIKDYSFTPIFNLSSMLGADRFAALPIKPATTMYYWQVDPADGKE
ncbi:MAG TPA: TadE/TadG family type IV pilus assembly protein [Pyrinomonadaceae bacterium]|jgi:Flp pilus assembly protein TadG